MRLLNRATIVGVLPLLLVAACVGGESYDEQVTFRIEAIEDIAGINWAELVAQEPVPGDPIKPILHESTEAEGLPRDVGVGDLIVCRVQQSRKNLADDNVERRVTNCRRA